MQKQRYTGRVEKSSVGTQRHRDTGRYFPTPLRTILHDGETGKEFQAFLFSHRFLSTDYHVLFDIRSSLLSSPYGIPFLFVCAKKPVRASDAKVAVECLVDNRFMDLDRSLESKTR